MFDIIIQGGELMSDKKSGKLLDFIRKLPIIICLVIVVAYFCSGRGVSPEVLASYAPKNIPLAICVLLFMYVVKSISVAFPIIILQVAATLVLSPPIAFIVNIVGVLIDLSLPYFIGRFSGMQSVEKLIKKHKKLQKILDMQEKNTCFLSFFLHAVYFLPGDIVSMYFGATGTKYLKYVTPSFLGMFPSVIIATFLGINIKNAQSEMIKLSLILTVGISLVSLLIYLIYRHRLKKKKDNSFVV